MTVKPCPAFLAVRSEILTGGNPYLYAFPANERRALEKTLVRHRSRTDRGDRLQTKWTARREFLRLTKSRRLTAALLKSRYKWIEVWQRAEGHAPTRTADRIEILRRLGGWLHRWENAELHETRRSRPAPRLCDRLPLFACSGELEATGLRNSPLRYHPRATHNGSEIFDIGRDGGGQHEIRFRIAGNLPAVACALVSRLGGPLKNGGHIHLNCQGNDRLGRQVFHAFRFHLSWFRFLAPEVRRRGRWSGVGRVPDRWSYARTTKAAAISANTWDRTGTVEVRLWATSKNPKDWKFRADLMRAMARWSQSETLEGRHIRGLAEELGDFPPALPVNRDTSREAWPIFFRWAAVNAPETLRQTLAAMKRRTRQQRDERAATMCREYVATFDASGIRLRGYRRTTAPAPAPVNP
jgi:hypothetical protein